MWRNGFNYSRGFIFGTLLCENLLVSSVLRLIRFPNKLFLWMRHEESHQRLGNQSAAPSVALSGRRACRGLPPPFYSRDGLTNGHLCQAARTSAIIGLLK